MNHAINKPIDRNPAAVIIGVFLFGMAMAVTLWVKMLPPDQLVRAIFHPERADINQLLFHFSVLPRLVVSLLAGAAFSLAGLLFQQILRNPLADPTTLGVSAGAHLALIVAAIWAPSLLRFSQETVALAGGIIAAAFILLFSLNRNSTPQKIIITGMMLTLYSGCLANVIALFSGWDLQDVFIWGSGTLNQNSWHVVDFLLPRTVAAFALSLVMQRAMATFALNEASARSLGISVRTLRIAVLVLASAISASVVSVVGIIGFIGLAAPTLTRLAGARRFIHQLLWTPVLGASLLLLTDQASQWLQYYGHEVPTGTLTALLGSPLLLWLIPRLKKQILPATFLPAAPQLRQTSGYIIVSGSLLFLILLAAATVYGRQPSGWGIADWHTFLSLLPFRGPRCLAAASAGGMLGVAGVLVQRLTANPMASPEILGISSGATLGVMFVTLLTLAATPLTLMAGALTGAVLALLAILIIGSRTSFTSEKILLAGIGLTSIISGFISLMMTNITPEVMILQDWLAGSTYRIFPEQALVLAIVAIVLAMLCFLTRRWLPILSLGDDVANSSGMNVKFSRSMIILLIALLTAAATLIIGPLSFVGLMAPHMARMSGFHRPGKQLGGAMLMGAGIVVIADWCGRNMIYPQQIPAGLLATFIGAPYYLYLMRKSKI